MSAARWLKSPLAATAAVMIGLVLIAVPLRKLTSGDPASDPGAAIAKVDAAKTPAVLRVKLLAPVKHLTVENMDGAVLLNKENLPAGELEADTEIDLTEEALEILLRADFGASAAESAVFLTVMPDGKEEQTRHAIGSGLLEEVLDYEWRHDP